MSHNTFGFGFDDFANGTWVGDHSLTGGIDWAIDSLAINPMVRSASPLGGTEFQVLATAIDEVKSELSALQGREDVDEILGTAFGVSAGEPEVADLLTNYAAGDFSDAPKVDILTGGELGAAFGAYAAETDTIYLPIGLLRSGNGDLVVDVLLEEFGHGLDARWNIVDSPGDEGAIFTQEIGNNLHKPLGSLKEESDRTFVAINGQVLSIEKVEFFVNESAGSISFPLTAQALPSNKGLNSPSQYTLSLDTTASTATPDQDFSNIFPIDVKFPGGFPPGAEFQTLTNIQLPIIDDDESEADETVILRPGNFQDFVPFNDPVTVTIFDDDGIDLDPLRVGGSFQEVSDGLFQASGSINIGRSDGIFPLVRLDGDASYDSDNFTASGTFYSEIGNVAEPLFQGSINIPIGSDSSTVAEETLSNAFKLGGLDPNIKKITFEKTGIGLDSDLQLPTELAPGSLIQGLNNDLSGQNRIFIGQSGIGFGNGISKASIPFGGFKLFEFLGIEQSQANLSYNNETDKLKIQGSFKLQADQEFFKPALDAVSEASGVSGISPEFSIDITGKNSIEIEDGLPNFNGSFTLKNLPFAFKIKIEELSVGLVTQRGKLQSASAKGIVEVPKELKLGADFAIRVNPEDSKLEFDRGVGTIDGINKPIPPTPLYAQRISLGLNNMAKSNPDPPQVLLGLGVTYGPEIKLGEIADNEITSSLKIPEIPDFFGVGLDDNASVSILRVDVDTELDTAVGSGTIRSTVLNPKFFDATGRVDWDFRKSLIEANLNISALSGAVSGSGQLISDTEKGTTSVRAGTSLKVPDNPIFLGLRGKTLDSTQLQASLSSQDYDLIWFRQVNLGSFLGDRGFGIRFSRDGGFKLIFSGKDIPPVGSYDVEENTDWIIMGATWDNETSQDVTVRVEKPDGTFIDESDFAANGISIVDALSGLQAKSVVVENPEAGIWDLVVVDETGLENLTYQAFRDTAAPVVEIANVTRSGNDNESVTINYTAFDSDSDAEIRFFYDTDNEGFDGLPIEGVLTETDGAGQFVWNSEGTATGEYFIYAMVMDENNAPVFAYAPKSVQLSSEADLSVTQTSPDLIRVGEAYEYTIDVTNNGTQIADNVSLINVLPEEVSFASASLEVVSQENNEVNFSLGSINPGETRNLKLTVIPQTTELATNTATVRSDTFDPDLLNNSSSFTTTLDSAEPDLELSVITPEVIERGQNFTYQMMVKNNSSSTATGVQLFNNLPGAVNFVSSNSSQGTSSESDRVVTAELGDLPGGASATIDIVVTPIAADILNNVASVRGNEFDSNPDNNTLISTLQVAGAEVSTEEGSEENSPNDARFVNVTDSEYRDFLRLYGLVS